MGPSPPAAQTYLAGPRSDRPAPRLLALALLQHHARLGPPPPPPTADALTFAVPRPADAPEGQNLPLSRCRERGPGGEGPPAELRWAVPPDSLTGYLLRDHLPVRRQVQHTPDGGWMARPGHLPTLVAALHRHWQARWQPAEPAWPGAFALTIGDQTWQFARGAPQPRPLERPGGLAASVRLSPPIFSGMHAVILSRDEESLWRGRAVACHRPTPRGDSSLRSE